MSRNAVLLVVLVLALLAVGLVMLYSATAVAAGQSPRMQDPAHFLKRQLLWAAFGIAAMAVTGRVPYSFWNRHRRLVLAVCIGLLCLVFVPGVGAELNAARRWIRLENWFFQPSEAAKIGIAVFLAGFAAADPDRLLRFFAGFVPAFGTIALVCGLILVEPDVGTSLFIALVMSTMLWVAGLRWRHLLPVGAAVSALLAVYLLTHTEHVAARLEAYLHPERDPMGGGLQIIQSKIALGSGSWFGAGLGRGTSKLSFLPEVHSDFIFPVIGEELGFAGAGAVLLLYMALGVAGFRILRGAPDRFGFLLSFALVTYIILQAAVNVAVATALVPTKGIPLPFVSAGGSSLVFTMVGVGILVSVANSSERGPWREGEDGYSSRVGVPAATSSRV
jgi:cell division protein FtsW